MTDLADSGSPGGEWSDGEHVASYLARADTFPHRREGERVLMELLAPDVRRVLDLGTGDGRLLARVQAGRPRLSGVGLDASELMLATARQRFAGDPRIALLAHDLAQPLPGLGDFDAVVSSLAIHHLEHPRKRALYREAFELLQPGGVFANFEHVASPTDRLHRAFYRAIAVPLEQEDPSNRLLDVETQLRWLREIGFEDVDCFWKYREFALLAGTKRRDSPPRDQLSPSGEIDRSSWTPGRSRAGSCAPTGSSTAPTRAGRRCRPSGVVGPR